MPITRLPMKQFTKVEVKDRSGRLLHHSYVAEASDFRDEVPIDHLPLTQFLIVEEGKPNRWMQYISTDRTVDGEDVAGWRYRQVEPGSSDIALIIND